MKNLSKVLIGLTFVLVIILGARIIFSGAKKSSPAKIDLFVMSKCPYGVIAESSIDAVREIFPGKVETNIYFIADLDKDKIVSMHGDSEVEENMRQLIINKYFPNKLWNYLKIRNPAITADNWQSSIMALGLNPDEIKKMVDTEGKQLLKENIKKAKELKAQASPTIYINDKLHEGKSDVVSLISALCKNSPKGAKLYCKMLPGCFSDEDCLLPKKDGVCLNSGGLKAVCEFKDAVKVTATVITSADCSNCDYYKMALDRFSKMYRGLEIRTIDVKDKEAVSLIKNLDIQGLPSVVLDKNIEKTKNFQEMLKSGLFKQSSDKESYLLSDKMVPMKLFINRARKNNLITLFVMSQCPFGISAENLLIERFKKGDLAYKLEIKYILSRNKAKNDQIESMHGKNELYEDVEQMVVRKYFKDKYFDYLLCRNKDIKDADIKKCADSVGIDVAQITKHAYDESFDLVSEEEASARSLNISASPTILFENQEILQGFEELKKLKGFEDLKAPSGKGSCR
jgi:predicted DsbA family dithiol-disulfide isomerase/thiol-disulfide isomerase/thioredoxin